MSDTSGVGGGGGDQPGVPRITPGDHTSEFNRLWFHWYQQQSRLRTAFPVKVVKVLKQDNKTEAVQGEVVGAGYVQVQILVSMADGNQTQVPHATIFSIPFGRGLSGAHQHIHDPVKGDIGVCTVMDRDWSSAKSQIPNMQAGGQDQNSQGNQSTGQTGSGSGQGILPGSLRMHSPEDCVFHPFNGVLTKKPQQYITHTKTGMQIGAGPEQQQQGGGGGGQQQDSKVSTLTLDNSQQNSGNDPALNKAQKGKTDTGVQGFLAQTFHGHQHGMGVLNLAGQAFKGILSKLGGSSGQGLVMKFDALLSGATMEHSSDGDHTMKVANGNFTHTITNGTHTETAKQIIHNGATNVNNGDLTVQKNVNGQNFLGQIFNGTIFNGNLGNFGSGSFAGSDTRMKTNSKPLKNALDAVMSIAVMRYNFHPSKFEKGKVVFTEEASPSFGVHAQELRRIFPELVRGNEKEELLSVNEAKLGILAIAALQQMQAQINTLKDTVDDLKSQLAKPARKPKG